MTAALAGAAVLLPACGGTATPTPTPSPSPQPTVDTQSGIETGVALALTGTATPAAPTADMRPTLPPTWTPTFTATPAPPTATITPSPTPTVTPTLSEDDICEAFYSVNNLRPGEVFAWDDVITLFLNAAPPGATVRFVATHHFSGANRGADLPGGQTNILQLPVKNLPQPGQYDWTLTVRTEAYGDICEQSGWFIAAGRNSTRAEEDTVR